jgi:periplasmic glucans biosynthesis protein
VRRRDFLGALAVFGLAAPAAAKLRFGDASPFTGDSLILRAKSLAQKPFEPIPTPSAEILDQIGYDQHGAIRYKPGNALWADDPRRRFPATFFHLGRFFRTPVKIFAVEGREALEILYDESLFDMPPDSPAHQLPAGLGFAGFRVQEAKDGPLDWKRNDWVAFLGASYFRAIGDDFQYGLSARGVMVDAAVEGTAEEFPVWREIYLQQSVDEDGDDGEDIVDVHALLDGPSLSGAFHFAMKREKAVTMRVSATLFPRRPIARLGVAPLTSMYWFSETQKAGPIDWRPEVHDSDGLMLITRDGEQLWRPLNNPQRTMVSSFEANALEGFGLMQRDRTFDNYLDGVRYQRRPSLWVEPFWNLGQGSVQLIEIPTDDEIHDNIVAAWVPEQPFEPGVAVELSYDLSWQAVPEQQSSIAQTVATRIGNGGEPGTVRPKGVRRFVIEFNGAELATLRSGLFPDVIVTTSRGTISNNRAEAVPNDVPGHWRAQFDLAVEGSEPVELRCYLRLNEKALSETWAYQFHPF